MRNHFKAMMQSFGQLGRTPFKSIITCLLISIALTLPTTLFVLFKNIETMNQHIQQKIPLTAYLKIGTTEKQALQLEKKLALNDDVVKTYLISPNEGLKELQNHAGLADALSETKENPLPWTLVIFPKQISSLENLTAELKSLSEIEIVQFNSVEIKRLQAWVDLGQRLMFALILFLSVSVLLMVSNAIRMTDPLSNRRPFLYAGIWYGLLGGILTWEFVDGLMLWLQDTLISLAELYHQSWQWIGLTASETIILLSISMVLGWLGSWVAVINKNTSSKNSFS